MPNDPGKYIDDEFETMRGMAVKGPRDESLEAVLKMTFIAGMSAALNFDGEDVELGHAALYAIEAIGRKYGGRTLFPINLPIEQCGKCLGTGEICLSSTSYAPCPECSSRHADQTGKQE
jgi:hypothetical protein